MTDEALERSIDELYTAPAAELVGASELKKEKRVHRRSTCWRW